MRAITAASLTIFVVTFVLITQGCTSNDDQPLFPNASTGGMTTPTDAGLDGETDANGDGAPLTCTLGMGQTACDQCAYEKCCDEALACWAGTPCDALWTCAQIAGCLKPQASDFDTCVVAACTEKATESAVVALEGLATCIRSGCSSACGG